MSVSDNQQILILNVELCIVVLRNFKKAYLQDVDMIIGVQFQMNVGLQQT